MDEYSIAMAEKTRAFFACLVCGYTGPLAYGEDGHAMCQRCRCAAATYLVPHCPACGLYIGMAAARAGADTFSYLCPSCGCAWTERRGFGSRPAAGDRKLPDT